MRKKLSNVHRGRMQERKAVLRYLRFTRRAYNLLNAGDFLTGVKEALDRAIQVIRDSEHL